MAMTKKATLDALLDANPMAKKQEQLIRAALRDVRKLRDQGISGEGYTLLPPFGEKRAADLSTLERKRLSHSK
jgi:hypothetical protein